MTQGPHLPRGPQPPHAPHTPAASAPSAELQSARAEPIRTPLSAKQWMWLALAGAALIAYPHVFDAPYQRHVLVMVFIYALMAQGWNVLAGYCGQISLGQAVYFGIGAYSAGFLYANYHISPWVGMLVGVVISVLVALGIGLPTFRLRGHYFAIATLVIGEIGHTLMLNWEFVGGATGVWIPIDRESPWYSFQFHDNKLPNYYIGLGFLAAACLVVVWLERSKAGLYFRAIRDEPDAARSLGVDITRYKLVAIMISAAFTAVAGAQFAQYVLVIDPETVFPLLLSILVVLMTMLGRYRNPVGPDHRGRGAVPALRSHPGVVRRDGRGRGPDDLRGADPAHLGVLSGRAAGAASKALRAGRRCLRSRI